MDRRAQPERPAQWSPEVAKRRKEAKEREVKVRRSPKILLLTGLESRLEVQPCLAATSLGNNVGCLLVTVLSAWLQPRAFHRDSKPTNNWIADKLQ